MKFAEGGTLSARIDSYRDKPRQAAALTAKLARAVAFAHEHGILHRDLKPGNVLFDSAGKPYVSDFGLAKWLQRECDLTQTLAILGTPYYMAPEQATDSRGVTAAADVYSLGAILYHLLAGRPPIWGETPMEVLHRAAAEKPKSPRLTNAPNFTRSGDNLSEVSRKRTGARVTPLPPRLLMILNDFAPATRSKLVPSASRTAPGAGRAAILLSRD